MCVHAIVLGSALGVALYDDLLFHMHLSYSNCLSITTVHRLRQKYPHDGHEHVLSIIEPMQLGVHELVDSTHDVCVRASSARSPCQTPSQTQAGAPFHPAHRAHGHFPEVYTRSSKHPPHRSAARLRCSRSSGSCTKSTACWSSSCSPGGRGPRPWRLEVCPVSGTL